VPLPLPLVPVLLPALPLPLPLVPVPLPALPLPLPAVPLEDEPQSPVMASQQVLPVQVSPAAQVETVETPSHSRESRRPERSLRFGRLLDLPGSGTAAHRRTSESRCRLLA